MHETVFATKLFIAFTDTPDKSQFEVKWQMEIVLQGTILLEENP